MLVQVLMSTFNGERFLMEQLESIYAQEGVSVDILVRDDDSQDRTPKLLKREEEKGKLKWYSGPNLKPARSFMDLLKHADDSADLYAFSDQDDVWDKDKIFVAANAIGEETQPALYFCQTRLVDRQLNDLPQMPITPKLTYGEALVYQFVSGCTMVINKPLRDVVNQYSPEYLRMHDMWIYDVALAIGASIFFDSVPHIKYRQHTDNSVGQTASVLNQWKERFQRMSKREQIRLHTAQELLKGYAKHMTPANRVLTEKVAGYRSSARNKLSLLLSRDITPSNKTIALTSRLAIMMNRF